MNWWRQRSARERLLLGFGAVAAVLALLVQFALVPTWRARQAAEARLRTAETMIDRLARLEQRAASTQAGPAVVQDVSLSPEVARNEAAALAVARGLTIARLQSVPPDGFSIAFDIADPIALQGWIDDAETRLGLSVSSAAISEAGGGAVRAQIAFKPRGAS